MPGQRLQLARDLVAIAAGVDHDAAAGELRARVDQGPSPGSGHRQVARRACRRWLGGRKHVGDTVDRRGQRLADGGDETGRQGARTLHRHLLAEHRSGEQFDTVGVAR